MNKKSYLWIFFAVNVMLYYGHLGVLYPDTRHNNYNKEENFPGIRNKMSSVLIPEK